MKEASVTVGHEFCISSLRREPRWPVAPGSSP